MTADRRPFPGRFLPLLVGGLTLAGVGLAATQPEWLVEPLRGAVTHAGGAAPLLYVALCVLAAPLGLDGVLAALSVVIWPLPLAASLTYLGTLTGCLLTALALTRLAPDLGRLRAAWPGALSRLAERARRRPFLTGIVARVAVGSGVALEAFFWRTGFTRRQYLASTLVGKAVWTLQVTIGVTALHALGGTSPSLAVGFVALPLVSIGLFVAARRLGKGRPL